MSAREGRLLVAVIAMGLTGTALVLSVPPLFGAPGPAAGWITALLGTLFVAATAVAFTSRP